MNTDCRNRDSSIARIKKTAEKVAQVLAEAGATYGEVEAIFSASKQLMVITATVDPSESCLN